MQTINIGLTEQQRQGVISLLNQVLVDTFKGRILCLI